MVYGVCIFRDQTKHKRKDFDETQSYLAEDI